LPPFAGYFRLVPGDPGAWMKIFCARLVDTIKKAVPFHGLAAPKCLFF
jgi:hypothetical protein